MKFKNTQLFYLVIKFMKPFAVPRACTDEKLREVSVSYFFILRITLMLSIIFSEPLMSVSNKHKYKTFSKSPPASLSHCIKNILSHSSGKCRDSLTVAALSFTNGSSEFRLCTIFVHWYLLGNSVIISSRKRRYKYFS